MHPQIDVVRQLSPILMWLPSHNLQGQNQAAPAPVTTPMAAPVLPVAKLVCEELDQGATPNADNLSAARCPASAAEENTISVIKAEVGALVGQKKEKVSSVATCLRLRLPYLASIAAKLYLAGYTVSNS